MGWVLGGCHGEVGETGDGRETGVGVCEPRPRGGDGAQRFGEAREAVGLDQVAELIDGEVVVVADVEGVRAGVHEVAEQAVGEGGLVCVVSHGASVTRRRGGTRAAGWMARKERTDCGDAGVFL